MPTAARAIRLAFLVSWVGKFLLRDDRQPGNLARSMQCDAMRCDALPCPCTFTACTCANEGMSQMYVPYHVAPQRQQKTNYDCSVHWGPTTATSGHRPCPTCRGTEPSQRCVSLGGTQSGVSTGRIMSCGAWVARCQINRHSQSVEACFCHTYVTEVTAHSPTRSVPMVAQKKKVWLWERVRAAAPPAWRAEQTYS